MLDVFIYFDALGGGGSGGRGDGSDGDDEGTTKYGAMPSLFWSMTTLMNMIFVCVSLSLAWRRQHSLATWVRELQMPDLCLLRSLVASIYARRCCSSARSRLIRVHPLVPRGWNRLTRSEPFFVVFPVLVV